MNFGTYSYFLNGKPTGVSENFTVEILPDGAKRTTAERDASPFGTKIFVEAIERGRRFERFQIRFQSEFNIQAVYEFSGNKFRFTRSLDGDETDDETFDLPENTIVFPLMRVFQGQVILRVADASAEDFTTVLIPSIENPADAENLLKPTFDNRRAEKVGRENVAFYQPDSITFKVDVYKYFTKHYDEDSRFRINADGLLVAYRFVQAADKIWEIFLTK